MKKKISLTNLAKEELSKGEKSLITAGIGICFCECWCGCLGGVFRKFNVELLMNQAYDFQHEFGSDI